MIKYPASIDDSTTLPIITNNTNLDPKLFNDLRDAILALEKELGTSPSSTFGTVKSRLNYLEYLASQPGQTIYLSSNNIPVSGNADLNYNFTTFTVETNEVYTVNLECVVAKNGIGSIECSQFNYRLFLSNLGFGLILNSIDTINVYPLRSDYSINFISSGNTLVVNVANANATDTANASAKLTWTKVIRS